jgi:hypothetical protein
MDGPFDQVVGSDEEHRWDFEAENSAVLLS